MAGQDRKDVPGEVDTVLALKRSDDRLVREVARAKIANQLFATDHQVKIGRYQPLEIVGSGGMGVVWGAWDPQLERRVAIKLVKPTLEIARERILFEGQALAKLSHPNVVPVFDVGVVDDRIYLVMEWVRGTTLRHYCAKPRTLHEVLAIYRGAGEGLAAAHHADLIHRDFKPDNAIVGDDGRVRVLDFGLARGELVDSDAKPSSDTTRGAGTPKYMPPEQAAGGTLTPAVDQYAFCIALREALVARSGANQPPADVPRWLEAVLSRGTAEAPRDRFPTMDDLLHALARDPRRVWRRRGLAIGAPVAIAAAFAIGNLRHPDAREPCVGGVAEIAETWSDHARGTLVAHLQSLGAFGADTTRSLPSALDSFAGTWAEEHRARCLAHDRGELTQALYERNLGCLARVRAGFDTAIRVLTSVPSERLADAIVAVRGVPDPRVCAIETLASTVTPPPPAMAGAAASLASQIERARSLGRADDPTALAVAQHAAEDAARLGYKPLIARAELAMGLVLVVQEKEDQAAGWLERATSDALDANDDAAFVEAYARELHAVSVTSAEDLPPHAKDIIGAVPFAEHLATRLGVASAFERALLFSNIGGARMAAGDPLGARAWFDRSLAEAPGVRENNIELVFTLGFRALVSEAGDRERLFREERETLTRALGSNHRDTLLSGVTAAMFVANRDAAAAALRDPCERLRTYHPTLQSTLDNCTFELGWLAEERGDATEGRAMMARVGHDREELAHAYLEAWDGKLDSAAARAHRYAAAITGEWWRMKLAANGFLVAAQWFDKLGRRGEAIADGERALAILDGLPTLAQTAHFERRRARTRALIARMIAMTNPARAKDLAGLAARWYRTAGGYDAIATEMETLTSSR